MMPSRCNYSQGVRRCFNFYLFWAFKKNFAQVLLRREKQTELGEGPLVLIANHCSWWDGFFLWQIQKNLRPKSAVYTVMLEKEYRRLPFFFRWLGIVPFIPQSASSVRSIFRTLVHLGETDPNCVIVFFPQGKIWPSTRRPLTFEKGIYFLLKLMPKALVLPVGIHIEPLQYQKPTAFLSVGSAISRADELEASVEKELDHIQNELHEFGEAHAW